MDIDEIQMQEYFVMNIRLGPYFLSFANRIPTETTQTRLWFKYEKK